VRVVIEWLDRQAEITERQYEERVANIERQIGAIKAANDDYRDEVDRLQRRNDELRTSYDKLKRERDNLAADLLTCNREREQLREHLGIALDHAHDICSLVDIDGNVLDVGD
jgi:chromosome segregation ATPase